MGANYQTLSSIKASIKFTESSSFALNKSATIFGSDTANDRIHVLQTLGVNYQKAWLYTNKLPFL